MKIIHCADVHLDSPLRTNLPERQANERNTEILQTFVRMTRFAREQEVRLVIIAGDLFDGARVSRRTVDRLLAAVADTPGVDYLYLPGNHDNAAHALFDRRIPGNLQILTDCWSTRVYGALAVSGIVMTEGNAETLYDRVPRAEGKLHIVVLHGQAGSAGGPDLVNLKRLQGKGIDYLALGHIHSYYADRLDASGIYCYPGCLEGRGFDECGEKGFVLLETGADGLSRQFVPFARRRLHRVSVDITGLYNNAEVQRKLEAVSAALSPEDMVEFLLTGESDPRADISAEYLQRENERRFFFTRVKDQSRLAIDPKAYQNDVSLKGAFIRLVLAGEGSDREKAAIIRAGIAALTGEEIML